MTPAARERSQVRAPVLFVSAAAWTLLVVEPGGDGNPRPPRGRDDGRIAGDAVGANPPASLAFGWALMLAAMMAPLLIAPVRHVRDRSFSRRRARSIGLFVAGYGAIWMAAGIVLMSIAVAVRLAAPESSGPLALAVLVATIWQFSPAQTTLSQSRPCSYGTGGLRKGGGYRRPPFRVDAWGLVRRFMLGADAVAAAGYTVAHCRHGRGDALAIRRTHGTAGNSPVGFARAAEGRAHCCGADGVTAADELKEAY